MKGQKKILGRKIIGIDSYDEYICATLDNGMEIEISGITTAAEAKRIKKEIEKDIEAVHKIEEK